MKGADSPAARRGGAFVHPAAPRLELLLQHAVIVAPPAVARDHLLCGQKGMSWVSRLEVLPNLVHGSDVSHGAEVSSGRSQRVCRCCSRVLLGCSVLEVTRTGQAEARSLGNPPAESWRGASLGRQMARRGLLRRLLGEVD